MSTQLLDAVPLTTLSGVGAAISDKLSRLVIHNPRLAFSFTYPL